MERKGGMELKKRMKILLLAMLILTVIYIGGAWYANAVAANYDELMLSARELSTQPPDWQTPEQLGIVEIIEREGWLHILVPKDKAYQLQADQPTFKYEDKFYQIEGLWATPELPEDVKQRQSLAITGTGTVGAAVGVGWIYIGISVIKEKRSGTKKIASATLLCLLMALTFAKIPMASVEAASEENLCETPGLPEEVRTSRPTNETTEEYFNTTNPYSDTTGILGAFDEVDDKEGAHPLYVLVFGDEEERNVLRSFPWDEEYVFRPWTQWAQYQLERGDEALVSNFWIDIRILDFLDWDSNDSLNSFNKLWYELEADTKSYLGTWYTGEYWSNYVDAVIGITAQATVDNTAGISPGPAYVDQGRIFILLKWQVYWADDNLVQHEVSHLFYAPDHYNTCCAMAGHTHWQCFIWEDGLWLVFNNVYCAYTAYTWCTNCTATINSHSNRYSQSDPLLGDVGVSTNEIRFPIISTAIPGISIVVLALVRYKKPKNKES